jgi:hypothetical protein
MQVLLIDYKNDSRSENRGNGDYEESRKVEQKITNNYILNMKRLVISFVLVVSIIIGSYGQTNKPIGKQLHVTYSHPKTVLNASNPDAKDIVFGFEGGRVVKVNGTYHLFTSEMYQPPMWVKMRFGHWISTDKLSWKRVSTIRESSGEFEGLDPRAALWSPLPVWDADNNEWNLFYVAYKAKANTPEKFLWNHEGRIWRSVSEVKGKNGINGPFVDKGIVMEPGSESQAWEGLQGTDSFFPYKVGKTWYAFYGSAKTEIKPILHWLVGQASAPSLEGKWIRSDSNPSKIEKKGIENPIVTPAFKKGWLMVYDQVVVDGAFGWCYSEDGINWPAGNATPIDTSKNAWCADVRTPLGLVDEGNGKYTLFYTGFEQKPDYDIIFSGAKTDNYCSMGFIELEWK